MTLLWRCGSDAVYQASGDHWRVLRAGTVVGELRLSGESFDPALPPEPRLVTAGDTAAVLDDWLRFIPWQRGITSLAHGDALPDIHPVPPPADSLADDTLTLRCTRRDGPDLKWGFPASDFFDIVAGGVCVGSCSLRIGYQPSMWVNGHIGYTIYPAHRGRRYAARAVRLLLRHAKAWRMPEVAVCCFPDNAASRRTCEIAGLRFEGEFDIPETHTLCAQGKRRFCRYSMEL